MACTGIPMAKVWARFSVQSLKARFQFFRYQGPGLSRTCFPTLTRSSQRAEAAEAQRLPRLAAEAAEAAEGRRIVEASR